MNIKDIKTNQPYDYTVIGSGPGGYVSAIRAAQLGLKTLVIEKDVLGGICLNWGCIPTKALLHSAHRLREISQVPGVSIENININIQEMVKHSRGIAQQLSNGIQSLLKKYKVDVLYGAAYVESPGKVQVRGTKDSGTVSINSKYIAIATGARPREFENMKFSKNIWSSKEAMQASRIPETLLIIGGGAIGLEFADFFQALGTQVTLLEAASRILPAGDATVSKTIKEIMQKRGMKIFENVNVISLKDLETEEKQTIEQHKKIEVTYENEGKKITAFFANALLAVGTIANIETIGFENTGGKIEKGRIATDNHCKVIGSKNIFAIGDITQGKQLAHKASMEGIVAAEYAASLERNKGHEPTMNKTLDAYIPSCTYTSPEIASVGYTQEELEKENIPFEVGTFPFSASGKAIAANATEGFAKVFIHSKTAQLLGAHLVGENVTEFISAYTIGMQTELTWHEYHRSVFPHPTLSEALKEAISLTQNISCNF